MERFQGFERWLPNSQRPRLPAGPPISPAVAARWFHALYESPLIFSGLLDSDGRVIDANRLSVEGCGLVREAVLGAPFWEGGWWSPDPALAGQIRDWCHQALATGDSLRAIIRYYRGDGSKGMVELGLDPIVDPEISEGPAAFIVATGLDISEVLAAQAEREDQLASERAASRLAEERFRHALDAMIDNVALARAVRDERGEIVDFELEYVNRASVDGAGRAAAELVGSRVTELYPSWRAAGMFDLFLKVVETGEPVVMERLSYDDALADGTTISGFWDMQVAKLGDGFIAASRDVTKLVRDEETVRQAKALAERERIAVEVLQQAALPVELPVDRRARIGVHYQPAVGNAPVGGDWYDVFTLGQDRVGLIIADVAGHGPDAAAFMVQLRNVLRAVAVESPDPDEILRRANQVGLALRATTPLVTCCVAVLDLAAHRLHWALAGHPPPVVLPAAGEVWFCAAKAGLPLCIEAGASYVASTVTVSPGDRIVIYTDGLIERRDESLDRGMQRLGEGVARSRHRTPHQAAEWLAANVSAGFDDVALVVVDITA